MDVYGPHTQVICLLKAFIFSTCKKNIIMYSQMGFQLYQSNSLRVTGLKSGKKSKYWVSGPFRPQCDLQIEASDLKSFTIKDYTHNVHLIQFEPSQTYHFQVTGQNM